jgi:hypothetical protein
MLDGALSTLLEDLDVRGLLDSTIVLALGEMGRAPKCGTAKNAGRDHWDYAQFILAAGGGFRGGTFLIRKADFESCKDAFIRAMCGRSDCPYCWRRRLIRTIGRATRCLLFADGDVRTQTVWVREIDWFDWPALNRSLRRRYGKVCGRLRARKSDNRALVMCQHPFKGAEALTPAQAVDRLLAAIDMLHTRRSSYRQLGCGADKKRKEWKRLAHYEEALDLGDSGWTTLAIRHGASSG